MSECLPCQQQTTYIGPGVNATLSGTQTISHGSCEGVTIDLLTMFLNLIRCVKTHNLYVQVNTTAGEINGFETILVDWIALKNQDPTTCEYQEKLPLIQVIINRIVLYGQC